MTPRILVIEGADATGTTTHADLLAATLRAEGHDARAFHHTKPATSDPILAALDYARQRRVLYLHAEPGEVIVTDRWVLSTQMFGAAIRRLRRGRDGQGLLHMANFEGLWLQKAHVVILDAHDRVLDARLTARDGGVTEMDYAIRLAYRSAVARFIDTARDLDVVAAEIAAWAREVLR